MNLPQNNSLGVVWRWLYEELKQKFSVGEAGSIADALFLHYLKINKAERVMQSNERIAESVIHKLQKDIGRLLENMPLQYVTGVSHFLDAELEVNPLVLIPRPETEELVMWIYKTLRVWPPDVPLTILDIGTGSGCIAIGLAQKLPQATVLACDFKPEVLEVAERNVIRNRVKVQTLLIDILNDTPRMPPIDIIVSNPPYVREQEKSQMQANVLDHEPWYALFVSDNDPLLFYRQISKKAFKWLSSGGYLFLEINEFLGAETIQMITSEGFEDIIIEQDFNGKDRFIMAKKPL